MQVNYGSGTVPPEYRCAECGSHGGKLWRLYQTFCPDLLCVECTCKHATKDPDFVDADGRYPDHTSGGRPIDSLGWYVAAIPVDGEDAYWGYTSIPGDALKWWRALPTRVKVA